MIQACRLLLLGGTLLVKPKGGVLRRHGVLPQFRDAS